MRNHCPVSLVALSVFFIACGNGNNGKGKGSIVFGDSSTIVTERDTKYLSNNVQDFVPEKVSPIVDSSLEKGMEKRDTVKALVVAKETVNQNNKIGLQAPFKALNIFIEGVRASTNESVDWNTAKGASFILNEGELNNKSLIVSGAVVTKILQRYQTVVLLEVSVGKDFKLSALPVYTSDWQTLKAANGKYAIAIGPLKYENRFSGNALRNAVQKLARNNRMSKKEEEQLIKSIRNVRDANQSPLKVVLQSVVWKIAAKDAGGKSLERELRIDINR